MHPSRTEGRGAANGAARNALRATAFNEQHKPKAIDAARREQDEGLSGAPIKTVASEKWLVARNGGRQQATLPHAPFKSVRVRHPNPEHGDPDTCCGSAADRAIRILAKLQFAE